MKAKAFTLIEVLITVMIVGLLTAVLFRTYKTMVDISLRVENEKVVQQELLYLSQAFQSLADRYTVDYSQYEVQDLLANQGLVDELYLVNEGGQTALIRTEGDCPTQSIEDEEHIALLRNQETPCQLVIEQEGSEATPLPSPKTVHLSHLAFKITPYVSNEQLLYSGVVEDSDEAYSLIQYPGFWFFARMYHRLYGAGWSTNAKAVIHQYYSTTDDVSI